MEKFYQEQVERIDRLMKVVEANDPYKVISGLSFYDIIVFTCQSMWHLNDWILNDPHFGASDQAELSKDIHATRLPSCLRRHSQWEQTSFVEQAQSRRSVISSYRPPLGHREGYMSRVLLRVLFRSRRWVSWDRNSHASKALQRLMEANHQSPLSFTSRYVAGPTKCSSRQYRLRQPEDKINIHSRALG
jgi:hypothetical protein